MLRGLLLLGRIEQAKFDAADAKFSAQEAQLDAKQLQSRVRVLEQQCERLTLAAMAMAEILRDRMGVTEYEIEAKIKEIDLRDGRLDGKLSPKPDSEPCQKCGQTNAAIRRHCLYCGAALASSSVLFPSGEGQPPSNKRTE